MCYALGAPQSATCDTDNPSNSDGSVKSGFTMKGISVDEAHVNGKKAAIAGILGHPALGGCWVVVVVVDAECSIEPAATGDLAMD